ncbi:cadherin-like domain-containing protein [Pseudomonas stutzeri]|nr:cadherin-like domain-containing protein [Stutzerimonas stutzeri]
MANDSDVDGDTLSVVAGTFVTAQGGSIVIAADGSYTYTPPADFHGSLLANDSDVDGDSLSVVAGTFVTAQGGSIVIAADGSYTYTPPADFHGRCPRSPPGCRRWPAGRRSPA